MLLIFVIEELLHSINRDAVAILTHL